MSIALGRYADLFSDYTELRRQENRARSVMLVNGDVVRNQSMSLGGTSARVWHGGVWGFASDAHDSEDAVSRLVQIATRNARFLARRSQRDLKTLPVPPITQSEHVYRNARQRSFGEVIDYLKAVDERLAERHPSLLSRTLYLAHLSMEKSLLTSDGASTASLTPRTLLIAILTVERRGEPFQLMEVFGGYGYFEDHFHDPAELEPALASEVEHLHRKAEAVYARAGVHDCILDARLAGILAHEAIGHTTEADLVLGGSVAGDQVGNMVATPLVSLCDFAHHGASGEELPVPVYVDDEGTVARDVKIIENGRLLGFMHNKETALRFGVEPTGNARAMDFSDEPLIRMRNTTFLPGDSRLEEMIESVEDGYYLMRSSNGQADSTSEFMFGVVLGYEIKNGKLGHAIRDTTLSGVAFDVLKTVSMVSNEVHWGGAGMCGKKQQIPVGMGGPAIKCRVHIGGQ